MHLMLIFIIFRGVEIVMIYTPEDFKNEMNKISEKGVDKNS